MHRTTLHDHVTRMADRLSQLARHAGIAWIVGLVRRYQNDGTVQDYVVVGRAGPVLKSRACSQLAALPRQLRAV